MTNFFHYNKMKVTTEKRTMGRHKKENTKNTYFQIRMDQETYNLLATTAHKLGISKAEVVRRGIVAQAKSHKA